MKIEQGKWTNAEGWNPAVTRKLGDSAQLILLFGSTSLLKEQRLLATIRSAYPKAHLLGCSTSGEICQTEVFDDSLVFTAIGFEHTLLRSSHVMIGDFADSFSAGVHLAESLEKNELKHVFVLSDGLSVNGSDLVAGLTSKLPADV
jgi:small ligand-binding sensory domain FIST